MVSHPVFIPILLDAIGEEVVAASDVPSVTRKRLLAHKNEEIKEKAEIAFASLEGGDRMAVYEDYKTRLHNDGDEEQGQIVFERDRKSTRLNSSHVAISYAVFCLKKKKK